MCGGGGERAVVSLLLNHQGQVERSGEKLALFKFDGRGTEHDLGDASEYLETSSIDVRPNGRDLIGTKLFL